MSLLNTFRLDGHRAIITGGGAGIGAGIARAFAEAGADVAVVARSADALAGVCKDIEAFGRRGVAIAADVTADGAPAEIVARAAEALGGVSILVNNVGGLGDGTTIEGVHNITAEAFRRQIDVNLTSMVMMSQAAAPLMPAGSAIINVSSIMAYKPVGAAAGYAASKAAMNNLTVLMAHELAPRVRVNGVAPGPILTQALIEPLGLKTQEDHDRLAAEWGLKVGRLGTVEDVAALALFLASPAASFITGQTVITAGGM
jgi:7-alpha-hydroxysteroid dehydrogenase